MSGPYNKRLEQAAASHSHCLNVNCSVSDEMKFTSKQGQYLAFIYDYTKIHGQPPAERDIQMYFRVSPPSIHQMVLTLEKNGLINRTPRKARSIRLLVPKEQIPQLD